VGSSALRLWGKPVPLVTRRACLVAWCVILGGCSGDELTLPVERAPTQLQIAGGDRQQGLAGTVLAEPLSVRVINAAGEPVQGATVVFSVQDGIVTPDTATTASDGLASTRWILAGRTGTQRAEARLLDSRLDLSVTFTATASGAAQGRLEIVDQPSNTAEPGVPLQAQPRIRLSDGRSGVAVVAALASGSGTLSGSTVQVTENGVASFTDLRIEGSNGPYRLIFAAPGFESVISREIMLRASATRTISIVEHKPDPIDVGRSTLMRVSISPSPTGGETDQSFTVTASNGSLCQGNIVDLTCEFIFNAPGVYTLVARLPATDGFPAAESAPVTHTVNAVEDATRTSVGAGPDPAEPGETLELFARVEGEGGTPASGSVIFYANGWPCGAGTVLGTLFELNSRGEGILRVPGAGGLGPGLHVIRGCFSGGPGFAPSEDVATIVIRSD
jgi:hypothetical protein